MKKKNDKHEESDFSPREFLRNRRPELFSDSIESEEPVIDRSQFEFYLNTLTSRKEELRFEHFCRRLAEKELCPNLLPQTGPTGGGDSKVDSETYPVADEIAERWYIGTPKRASSERWAFAFSAKKAWTTKVKSDVAGIVGTKRGYKVIYFMTNQAVSDKSRAKYEDDLSKKYKCKVRILDRTWIIERVITNRRWDIVAQTLDYKIPTEPKSTVGPSDVAKSLALEELEQLLNDPDRYQNTSYQLFEDSMQSALLARGLDYPRSDVDGRFARAERIARDRDDSRQLLRVLYSQAWTANFWYEDFAELNRLYNDVEALALQSESVWDLDNLANLWNAGTAWRANKPQQYDEKKWAIRRARLREAFVKHSLDSDRKTASLWARTQIVLLDAVAAAHQEDSLSNLMQELNNILREVDGRVDYPVDDVAQIILELGALMEDDENYNELNESVVKLQSQRAGEAKEGAMRFKRGFQLLNAGKKYAAIDQLGKAQTLLAKEEHKEYFIRALVGTALGYEKAGLLWAARANLAFALGRTIANFNSGGAIEVIAIRLLRKLIWLELQLGRVHCVLAWIELLRMLSNAVELTSEEKAQFDEDDKLIDIVLGILLLRSRLTDLAHVGSVVTLLERLSLIMSSTALLFALGHEDKLRAEMGEGFGDLDDFFVKWTSQPAAKDLPLVAQWHATETVTMNTTLLGSKIQLLVENNTNSILFAESILGFLESFFATALGMHGLYAMRERLEIDVRQSEYTSAPFENRISEDDTGETKIVVLCVKLSASSLCVMDGYQEAFLDLLTRVISELKVFSPIDSLEELFAKHRAQDRSFLVTQTPISVSDLLSSSPKYHLENWSEYLGEPVQLKRLEQWHVEESSAVSKETIEKKFKVDNGTLSDFDVERFKHSDVTVMSPINFTQWDRAGWCGVASLVWKDSQEIPDLILTFTDPEAPIKIFRGWQKRVGAVDSEDWIGVTIITGIDADNPMNYRIVLGVNEDFVKRSQGENELMSSVFRMKDVTPENDINIKRFIDAYKEIGRYRLAPGLLMPGDQMPRLASNLAIEKRSLRVVPAWEIGTGDLLAAAMGGIDNPLIPPDIENAPVLELIRSISAK